jgi:sugar lactone lactonase YvrE
MSRSFDASSGRSFRSARGGALAVCVLLAAGLAFAVPASATTGVPQLSVFAGTAATNGTTTVGGAASNSLFQSPEGVAADASGNVYIADTGQSRIFKVNPVGTISYFVGDGTNGAPVAGAALSSALGYPKYLATNASGDLYIGDSNFKEVLEVTPGGQLSIIAGNGTSGSLTAGTATSQSVEPQALAVDSSGNIYVFDSAHAEVVKVTTGGALTIIAGDGVAGAPTVGAAATSTDLDQSVSGLAVDGSGNVYIADGTDQAIYRVSSVNHTVSVFAGIPGSAGAPTTGPATSSTLYGPLALAIDPSGSIYIADRLIDINTFTFSAAVEKVSAAGALTVITGIGAEGQPVPGDATASPIGYPDGITIDNDDNLYIADNDNAVVEKIGLLDPPPAPTGLTATAGNASTTVSFIAPVNVGNSPITGYQYQLDSGSWVTFASAPTGSPLTATISGLTNGTTYALHVRAVNAIGDGDASAAVNVTPAAPQNPAPPPAPTSAVAAAGVSSVTVTWTAPSPATGVTGYTVLAQPGPATCSTSSVSMTTCLIGATVGTSYSFTVTAHSASGDSPASTASATVTPTAPDIPATVPLTAPTTLTTTQGAITEATAGQQVTVVGTGFAAYSTATIIVYSSPTALANVTTDAQGNFTDPVTVPSDLAAGDHNLVASGVDPTGAQHLIRLAFTIAADTPLAQTGAPTATLIQLGLLLVTAGGAITATASRRSRKGLNGHC